MWSTTQTTNPSEFSITPVVAGGESWKWQLRDSKGKWVEMGAKVKWMAKGVQKAGEVVGSPKPGVATVEEDKTKDRSNIASSRLTVYDMGSYVKGQAQKAGDGSEDAPISKEALAEARAKLAAKKEKGVKATMAKKKPPAAVAKKGAKKDPVPAAGPQGDVDEKVMDAARADAYELAHRYEQVWDESDLSDFAQARAERLLKDAIDSLDGKTANIKSYGRHRQAMSDLAGAISATQGTPVGKELVRIRKKLESAKKKSMTAAGCAPKKRKRKGPMVAAIASTSAARMAGRISAREAGQ